MGVELNYGKRPITLTIGGAPVEFSFGESTMLASLKAAQAQAAADNFIAALGSPTVENLPGGSAASVGIDGSNLTFGIPQGDKGDTGGVDADIAAVINEARGALANKADKLKVTLYAAGATHTKATNAYRVRVIVHAGGGGGGGGAFLAASTAGSGGAGGGGGARFDQEFDATAVSATTTVTVGAGGAGGNGGVSGTAATAGSAGGNSSFGSLLVGGGGGGGGPGSSSATSGGGGAGGLTAAVTGGTAGGAGGSGAATGTTGATGTSNSIGGGSGSGCSATGTPGVGGIAMNGAGGGSGGGGITAANAAQAGSAGSRALAAPSAGATAGTTGGGAGGTLAGPIGYLPGGGGGGGGASTGSNGGAGGAGQPYGAGGGGGGASQVQGGAGGAGGAGFVLVIEYIATPSALSDVTTGGGLPAGLQAADALAKAAKTDESTSARGRLIYERDYVAARASGSHAAGLNLPTAVADGEPIRFVTMRARYVTAGDYFKLQLYRRPISATGVSNGPVIADDTLMYNLTLDPATNGLSPNSSVSQELRFDLGEDYYRDPGTDLIAVLTGFDNTNTQHIITAGESTNTSTDQYVLGWYKDVGAGTWTNRAGRSLRMRVEASEDVMPLKTYAEPASMSAEDRTVYEWVRSTNGGMNVPAPILSRIASGAWPGMSTLSQGLAKLVANDPAAAAWPSDQLQNSVDFGRPSGLPSPTAGTAHPAWDGPNARIFLRDTTPAAQQLIDNYSLSTADINATSGAGGSLAVSNSIFDGGGSKLYGVYQQAPEQSKCEVSYSEFYGYTQRGVYMSEGLVERNYIHDTQADGIFISTTRPKRIMRNLLRKLGQIDPATHADGIQVAASTSDLLLFGNTIYMPHSTSIYNESSFGTTNVLNFNNASGAGELNHDFVSVNDLLIGGGYTVQLMADAGSATDSFCLIGSWFALPMTVGGAYVAFGSFYPGAGTGGTRGRTNNILIHNCRYLEDGSPVAKFDSSAGYARTDLGGLWDYNKASAGDHFLRMGKILGYLDWNGDPLVPVRTGFHTGTVV